VNLQTVLAGTVDTRGLEGEQVAGANLLQDAQKGALQVLASLRLPEASSRGFSDASELLGSRTRCASVGEILTPDRDGVGGGGGDRDRL
jgi:hypothetical protein